MPDDLNNPSNDKYSSVDSLAQTPSSQTASDAETSGQSNPSQSQVEQSSPVGEGGVSQLQQPQPGPGTGVVINNTNPPSRILDRVTNGSSEDKSQKIILFLAIIFFVFSLIGLGFYVFSGVASGRFSIDLMIKKKQPLVTIEPSSSALLGTTPLATPVAENLLYKDSVLLFEYPRGLLITKAADNQWLVNDDESGETIATINLASLQKIPVEDFLVGEVLKLDKKLDKATIRGLVVVRDIGNYTVYSYTLSDNSIVFAFEDETNGNFVKILDFSYKIRGRLEGNVAETVISTFSFVEKLPRGSSSPSVVATSSSTPVTRFNTED